MVYLPWVVSLIAVAARTVTAGTEEPFQLPMVVPGAYIVEFEDGQDSALSRRQIEPEGVIRLDLDFQLFKGVSIQLSGTGDAEEQVARLSSHPSIKNIWPVGLTEMPRLMPDGRSKRNVTEGPAVKRSIFKRQSTGGAPIPHIMTQVDKVHAKGITGKGIKIALIDSGVDYNHPALGGCFGKDCLVRFGRDLVGDDYIGPNTPVPDDDPMDCNGHGTHVAGIIAAQENDVSGIGVAPGAILGSYRVFGCEGSVADDVLLAALNEAYEDGADIITASLGGRSGWSSHVVAAAVSRIVEQGVPVTFAAGNSGNTGMFSVEQPASGKGVTAVASVDNELEQEHFPEGFYRIDNGPLVSFGYEQGYPFNYFNVSRPVHDLSSGEACSPLSEDTPDLSDFNVLTYRTGECEYEDQARNIIAKGGRFLIVYVDSGGIPIPAVNEWELPGLEGIYAIQKVLAQQWSKALADGSSVSANFLDSNSGHTAIISFPNEASAGGVSYFSSWGPTWEMEFKPQLAAPGGYIVSTWPAGGYRVSSGTSMACPFAAGAYALLAEARGSLDPALLKNVLASTSKPTLSVDALQAEWRDWLASPAQQGAGLIQVDDAITATAFVSPAGLSFNDTDHLSRSLNFTIHNDGAEDVVFGVSHAPSHTLFMFYKDTDTSELYPPSDVAESAQLEFSQSSVTVKAGGSATINVLATPPENIDSRRLPVYSGYIAINGSDSSSLSLPYLGLKGSLHDASTIPQGRVAFGTVDRFGVTPINANTTVTLPPPGTPAQRLPPLGIQLRLSLGSPKVTSDIVPLTSCPPNTTTAAHGVKTIGQIPRFPALWNGKGSLAGDFYGQLSNGDYAPPGRYKVVTRVLRIFGDEAQDEDWTTFESNPFYIRYES